MTRTRLDVVPLTQHIGAEIRGLDLREQPDEETTRAIYQAWLDHLVIVFPGQKLSPEDLIRVTGYFGELGEDDYLTLMMKLIFALSGRQSIFRRAIRACCPGSC